MQAHDIYFDESGDKIVIFRWEPKTEICDNCNEQVDIYSTFKLRRESGDFKKTTMCRPCHTEYVKTLYYVNKYHFKNYQWCYRCCNEYLL